MEGEGGGGANVGGAEHLGGGRNAASGTDGWWVAGARGVEGESGLYSPGADENRREKLLQRHGGRFEATVGEPDGAGFVFGGFWEGLRG